MRSRHGGSTPSPKPASRAGYVNRHCFHSLYFREPGGVLYVLATQEPGFIVDGLDLAELGTKIILPPFLGDHALRRTPA